MTPLINCQSISKTYGAQLLFSDISISIGKNEQVGLIGPNGSGKSTLLKLCAGMIQPDTGEIAVRKDIRICYLDQDLSNQGSTTVHDVLYQALSSCELEEQERYSRIQKWIAKAELGDGNQPASSLSGGWRKRLDILCSIIQDPDVLLLDEPTNHLDLEGICWLENLLHEPEFSFILITHDRYFLENTTNRMVELNRQFPDGYLKVQGNYSDYLLHKEALLNQQLQLESALANKARRETEWLNRGPKARTSKARFRIEEAYRLREEHSDVRKRMTEGQKIGFDFDATHRKTKKLISAKNLSKTIGGKQLFSHLDLLLSPGKCIGLLGRNGTGKSTLVSILAGRLQPDEGSIRRADDLKIVLFDQNREQLDQSLTLKEALSPGGDSVIYQGRSIHVASWAKRFLFEKDKLVLPISQLSGGEQARILIANLMLQPVDVLLLDEPTNDLDIASLEVLEQSIESFPGAVVLVTHDRFLLDRLADSIIGFDGHGNAANFADFRQWMENLKKHAETPKTPKAKSEKPKQKTRKLTYKEQLELEKIESKILKAEQELENQRLEVEKPEIVADATKLQESCTRLQQAQETVDHLYARWETLETIKSQGRS